MNGKAHQRNYIQGSIPWYFLKDIDSGKETDTFLNELLRLSLYWLRFLGFEDPVLAVVLTKHSPGMFSVQPSPKGRQSILGTVGLEQIFSLYDPNTMH